MMQTNPNETIPPITMFETPQGRQIALRHRVGTLPTVLYLHGYASDMMATKACYFDQTCADRGQAYLRFDCSGNGSSPGDFSQGTIGRWIEDALAVLDSIKGPVVLVGSSMGGWIGLHCALKRPERIKAFIGIAAAPDFTDAILSSLSPDEKALCQSRGYFEELSSIGEPLRLYEGVLQEGQNQLLLKSPINIDLPVVLVQGKRDAEVPWMTAEKIKEAVTPAIVDILYIEDGDHRLARIPDMELIDSVIQRLSV